MLVTLFWTHWNIFIDQVPAAKFHLTTHRFGTLIVPFSVSRWWDIAVTPLWVLSFLTVFKKTRPNDIVNGCVTGFVVSTFFALGVCIFLGMCQSIVLPLVFGLVAILTRRLGDTSEDGLYYSGLGMLLGYGIAVGIVNSLVYGFGFILVAGPIFWMIYKPIQKLSELVKFFLCYRKKKGLST